MALSTSGSSALNGCKEALASTKLASTWILALHSCPGNVLTKKGDTKAFVSVGVEPLLHTVGLDRATSPGAARMRSRASRRRLSDNDHPVQRLRRRWFPARPARHVHSRRNNGKGRIQSELASAHGRNGKRRVDTCKPGRAGAHRPSEALHPTRSTDRAAADRAGARPYRAKRCENASKWATPDRADGPF